MPAFQEGIARQKKEVEVIAASTEAPTFANTIEAVERTGELLTKVNNVFYALTDNNTNEELQKIEAEIAPLLAKHRDDISLNDRLFQRVKAVWREGRRSASLPSKPSFWKKPIKNSSETVPPSTRAKKRSSGRSMKSWPS